VTGPDPAVVDRVLWPLLDELRKSAARQLGAIARPVCEFPVYSGSTQMPADRCDCQCPETGGQGAGWVRLVNATTVTAGARTSGPCHGGTLNVTVEIGVYRCAPVAHGEPLRAPSAEEYEQHSRGFLLDGAALHRALLCSTLLDRGQIPWQMLALTPLGPQGGCSGLAVTAQVQIGNCCPVLLSVAWEPDPDQPRGIVLHADGYGNHGASVQWGDGITGVLDRGQPVGHIYENDGQYQVVVADRNAPDQPTAVTVHIGPPPVVHLFVSTEDDWRVVLWLGGSSGGEVLVRWGDRDETTIATTDDDGGRWVAHQYRRAGAFDITVTDTATRRATTARVDVGDLDLRVDIADTGARALTVAFARVDADLQFHVPPAPDTEIAVPDTGQVTVPLAAPGTAAATQMVRVTELVDERPRRTSVLHTARLPHRPLRPSWAWETDGDQQTVTVHVPDQQHPVVVGWDEDTTSLLQPGQHAQHTYPLPLPAGGQWVTLHEDTATDPATAARLLTAPRYIGEPQQVDAPGHQVRLAVAGVDPGEADTYQVDWGDGAVDPHAASGRWSWARHTYAQPGTYTVTITAPGMADPHTTTAVVVDVPPAGDP
jgi:hypothetical protein